VLTLANVHAPSTFHQARQVTLPAVADGPPVITSVYASGAWVDLAIVTTKAGDLQAHNLITGALFWTAPFPAGSGRINNGSTTCYTTSSPVVVNNEVYTYGLDGKVHKVALLSGFEIQSGGYQGHLVAIDLANAQTRIFKSLCSNQTVLFEPAPAAPDRSEVTSGVWARAGTTYDPATARLYFTTGNAIYSPADTTGVTPC
jgi:hypothetical protein